METVETVVAPPPKPVARVRVLSPACEEEQPQAGPSRLPTTTTAPASPPLADATARLQPANNTPAPDTPPTTSPKPKPTRPSGYVRNTKISTEYLQPRPPSPDRTFTRMIMQQSVTAPLTKVYADSAVQTDPHICPHCSHVPEEVRPLQPPSVPVQRGGKGSQSQESKRSSRAMSDTELNVSLRCIYW